MVLPKWFWLFLGVLTCACSSERYLNSQITQAEVDFKDHVGFVLYDPLEGKTIYSHQGDRYFQPASNTKIFTFYTALKLLGDSIPVLHYIQKSDSLVFWGTGAPGFLYDNVYQDSVVYRFLKDRPERLFFSPRNFYSDRFGPGWAWDDYGYAFQVERTPFPIYGNLVRASAGSTIQTKPQSFKNYFSTSEIVKEKPAIVRHIQDNRFEYFSGVNSQFVQARIPFHTSDELFVRLLSDTLKKEVELSDLEISPSKETIYAGHPDSLYKVMMQRSDNFIAEQLLLLCAGKVSDSLYAEAAIRYATTQFLSDLPDKPIWVDGSGLSRYNLVTPGTVVELWKRIYILVPRERLFSLLAIGGKAGTLKNYYKATQPYIYGKTGSFNNNHALSGYLVTKRGHTLIFSWMNNNFAAQTADVRNRMETVLNMIYEKY